MQNKPNYLPLLVSMYESIERFQSAHGHLPDSITMSNATYKKLCATAGKMVVLNRGDKRPDYATIHGVRIKTVKRMEGPYSFTLEDGDVDVN